MIFSLIIGCVNVIICFNSILAQTPLAPTGDSTTDLPIESYGIQLEKFKELRHHLRSGPIVIVNKNTFFVPNLHYDGLGPDAHFWVGNGTEPDERGLLVPDENGSITTLKAYNGENVYVTLPEGVTIDSIDYFGLWCIEYKQNFGHVTIPKDIKDVPQEANYLITEDNRYITRVQKCCPISESMDHNKNCVAQNQNFSPNVDVQVGNYKSFFFVPFFNRINCIGEGKSLQTVEGNHKLFLNGSLLIDNAVWNQDDYCIETCNVNNKTNPAWKTVAVICKSNSTGNQKSVTNSKNNVARNISSISVLLPGLLLFLFIYLNIII